jgi:hypothetical protein
MAQLSLKRTLPRAFGVLALCCAAALLLGVGASRGATTVLLGSGEAAEASCPAECLVEAKVTGYQTSIEGSKKPFVAPAPGRIVSWSIKLGLPEKRAIKGFNRRFGESKARISILKPIRDKRGKKKYVLLRHSKARRLRRHFGKTVDFTLRRPLKLNRGHLVALTLPTWAPAFSVQQSDESRWQASRAATRKRGKCFTKGGFANIKAGAPHQKLDSERAYGCSFRGARLLYWATFVAK